VEKSSTFFPKAFTNNDSLDLQSSLDIELLNRIEGHSNFAISLSGGTDSSIIALRSARLGFRPVTYSLGFTNSDKERYSEDSIAAKNISKKLELNFQLVEMPLPNLIPEILTQYVAAMEEPNSNPTGLSMMVLYSAMSKNGEKLVLTGDGADEIFGGYDRYKKASQISLLPQFGKSIIAQKNRWKHLIPKKIQDLLIAIEPANSDEFWLFWHSINEGLNLNKLYHYESKIELESIGGKALNALYGNGSRTSELMIKDLFTWLIMESNRKLDRISMWNSIEARSPFQSERMIAKAFSKMKQTNYKVSDKYFLKQSIDEFETLPLLKNKKGFISPLGHWIRSNPDMVLDSLEHLKHLPFFDKQSLDKLKKSIYKNDYRDFKLVWSLVVFSYWIKYAGNKL
jgi:asparagine synthase (glutamine-hydrolysing)